MGDPMHFFGQTIFGLVKDDHRYTLHKDIKAPKRKLGMNKEYTLDVEASTNCHINTSDEPIECRMIAHHVLDRQCFLFQSCAIEATSQDIILTSSVVQASLQS